jgi:large conductance mechanosensitive channel
MGMIKEFKEFALKGNVIDLAVGVVIGAAFGKIVGTLVEKIIMPVVGFFTGGIDFSKHDIPLGTGETAVQIGVGTFATEVINFLIIAFAIFMAVKVINSMKRKEEAAPQATPEDILLLREIRDSLKR